VAFQKSCVVQPSLEVSGGSFDQEVAFVSGQSVEANLFGRVFIAEVAEPD